MGPFQRPGHGVRKAYKKWGQPRFHLASMLQQPSPYTSPLLDRREKLRVRLMPSQLPGSSLMMPTLVFQVVQFTSSTLQGKETGGQEAGSLRAMPSFPGQGVGPTVQTREAHRSGWEDLVLTLITR